MKRPMVTRRLDPPSHGGSLEQRQRTVQEMDALHLRGRSRRCKRPWACLGREPCPACGSLCPARPHSPTGPFPPGNSLCSWREAGVGGPPEAAVGGGGAGGGIERFTWEFVRRNCIKVAKKMASFVSP